jgi:hypothetical protein
MHDEHTGGTAIRSEADGPRGPRGQARAARGAPSLGEELERERLELRVRRVEAVVAALRRRARDHHRQVRRNAAPLHAAIADFEAEIAAMRTRMRLLADGGGER